METVFELFSLITKKMLMPSGLEILEEGTIVVDSQVVHHNKYVVRRRILPRRWI
jgi:hypothetical protein